MFRIDQMNTLYIIGNGFDLWHGLPTKYADFSKFLIDNNFDFGEFDEYFNFKTIDQYLWKDFENELGTFNWKGFYEEKNNVNVWSESFKPSMMYSVEDDIKEQTDNLVESMKEAFSNWIAEIDVGSVSKKYHFDQNAFFITFNYTLLLEIVYQINSFNIFHIHGDIKNDYQAIVFGHDRTMEEIPEQDENGDSNRTIFTDADVAAKYPFHAFYKPVRDIIKENSMVFKRLIDVNKIVILGHSLNKIDMPYFEEIRNVTKNAIWQVSYYSCDERMERLSSLKKIGIDEHLVTMFKLGSYYLHSTKTKNLRK
jgi:hypothetical protein